MDLNPQNFSADIEKELGISDLPKEARDELVVKIGQVALERVLTSLMEKVPENKRDELIALSEAGDQNKLTEFMKENVPDMENVVSSEIKSLVQEFKETKEGLEK